MKGFRIDCAEGGFILRELHPNPKKKQKRKYAVAATVKDAVKVVRKWLQDM